MAEIMSECPRCGFVQPKDRYCANCGLDIQSYQPKVPAWHQQLIKSPVFHLSAGLVLILATVAYIFVSHRSQLSTSEIQSLSPADELAAGEISQTQPATQTHAQSPPAQNKPARGVEPQAAPAPSPSTTDRQREAKIESAAATSQSPNQPSSAATAESAKGASAPASDATAPASLPQRLLIQFTEIPRNQLDQLIANGEILASSDHVQAASIKGSKSSALTTGTTILPGGRTARLVAGQPILLTFYPRTSMDEDLGLSIQLLPTRVTGERIELELEGVLTLPTENNIADSYTFTSVYSFPTNASLVIAGILPRRPLSDAMAEFFINSPIAIMDSEDYTRGITDFAILIKPQ